MANMTLNSSNSIKLWQVDTETGELALKADVYPSVSSSARLDHISVTGDVSTGNFKLYAAIKDTKYVVRWTYSYTFEKEFAAPLIIFNDGKNQSNGALEPGDQVIANKVYTVH